MNAFAGSLRDRNSSTGCLVTFVVRGKSFFFRRSGYVPEIVAPLIELKTKATLRGGGN